MNVTFCFHTLYAYIFFAVERNFLPSYIMYMYIFVAGERNFLPSYIMYMYIFFAGEGNFLPSCIICIYIFVAGERNFLPSYIYTNVYSLLVLVQPLVQVPLMVFRGLFLSTKASSDVPPLFTFSIGCKRGRGGGRGETRLV